MDNNFLSPQRCSKVLANFLSQSGLHDSGDNSFIFYDIGFLKLGISQLQTSFPASALHAIALKANPILAVIKKLPAFGVGLEVASFPELHLAVAAGFDPEKIVFDSPAKTMAELEFALAHGFRLNADSFAELDRIAGIIASKGNHGEVGIRINPQVGSGTISITSVAGDVSKFGIPLRNHKEALQEAVFRYDWLRTLHVHIGSQGCPLPLLTEGIKKVVEFAVELNTRLHQKGLSKRIHSIDIGGGLAVNYYQSANWISFEGYAENLRREVPALFDGSFNLITEFGRHIHAPAGWVASRVEYVKREIGYTIVIIHVGADLFLRECYHPSDWHHVISVTDSKGRLKTGRAASPSLIAGPLCFSGDVIARDLYLPEIEAGDYIIIHDAGAYTLSMWSRYNSRQMPKVIGYEGDEMQFELLKKREEPFDLIQFWS